MKKTKKIPDIVTESHTVQMIHFASNVSWNHALEAANQYVRDNDVTIYYISKESLRFDTGYPWEITVIVDLH